MVKLVLIISGDVLKCHPFIFQFSFLFCLPYRQTMGWRWKPGQTPQKHRRRNDLPHGTRGNAMKGRSFCRFMQRAIVEVYKYMEKEARNNGTLISVKKILYVFFVWFS